MANFPLKWDGGVNQLADPQSIADNQVVNAKNAYPQADGTLDKREVVRSVGDLRHALHSLIVRPITLFVPDPVLGLDFILHGTFAPTGSGEFITVVNLNQILATTPPSVETIYFNLAPNNINGPASIANYRGRVLAVAGFMEGFAQLKRVGGSYSWDQVTLQWPAGTAGTVAAQIQSIPVQPRILTIYRGRVVLLNFGPGMGNWLVFGDRDTQAGWTNVTTAPPWAVIGNDVLAANGRHLELAAIQGEDITCSREVSLQATGSPLQTALLILTGRHCIIATGEPSQTTDSGFSTPGGYIADFVANKVNYECGCVGPQAITDTPYGTVWASDDDVWLLQGNAPMRVGTLIRPVLQNTPPNFRKYWSMAYANGTVFLAIVTQATASDLDMRVQHWRLDLRNGVEKAVWYGPQDYESLPDYAAALDGATYTLGMTPSMVSKRGMGPNEVVYGAIAVGGYTVNVSGIGIQQAYPRINFITYNESKGSEDIPFREIRTGRVWSADDNASGYVVPLGEIVRPTIFAANGHLYVCTTSGVPGAVEPTWNTGTGSATNDGGVVWTEIQNAGSANIWNRLPYYYVTDDYKSVDFDILFKDLNFGQPKREKLVRRADVVAAFSTKSLHGLRCTIEQGAKARMLGPSIIGLDHDHTDLAILDTDAITEEYQARALRPNGTATHDVSVDNFSENITPGIVRGRDIQPRFLDDDGYVIDDSNDYLAIATYLTAKPITIMEVRSFQIQRGRYNDLNELMNTIKVFLNTNMGFMTQGLAFTWNTNPWSYTAPYSAGTTFPYFVGFSFDFTARRTSGPSPYAMAFLFGSGNGENSTTLLGQTVYPRRTKRLLGMLGYDVSSTFRSASGLAATFADGTDVQLMAEQEVPTLTTPTTIWGTQIVSPKRRPIVSLSDVDLDYYVKPGLPFSKRNR